MTTTRGGIPTTITPLTVEQRIARAAKRAEEAAAAALVADEKATAADDKADAAQEVADEALLDAANAQADADTAIVVAGDASADAAAAQLDVDGALDGTTPFTGLNVGGTNVKPFLDKTDGASLTNSTGLGGDVVTSPAVALGTINQTASVYTLGLVTVSPSSNDIVQTLTVTVEADEVVDLFGQVAIAMPSPSAVNGVAAVEWVRGATSLGNGYTSAADTATGATPFIFQPVTVSVNALDVPGAGTWTYDLMVGTGTSNTADATRRSARISTYKRSA